MEKSPKLKTFTWKLEYLLLKCLQKAIRPLPAELIWAVGASFGTTFYYLSRSYRELSYRNLRIAFGDVKSADELKKLNLESFQKTFANLISAAHTSLRTSEQVSKQVTFEEGSEQFLEAVKEKNGVILVLGHMGNWEALNRLHHYLPPGTSAGGIYQPIKNPFLNKQLLKMRTQDGSHLFSKRDGFHKPAEFVREGGILAIVADQRAGKGARPVKFFDRLTPFSPLPALLAKKAKAKTFAAGIVTTANAKWHVVFEEVTTPVSTESIAQALEQLIKKSPADYLWMHDRWRTSNRTPLCLKTKKATTSYNAQTKAMQCLLLTDKNTPPTNNKTLNAIFNKKDLRVQINTININLSSTPKQLSRKIIKLDASLNSPLEIALIVSDSFLAQQAVKISRIPRSFQKPPNEELFAWISRLSTNPLINN